MGRTKFSGILRYKQISSARWTDLMILKKERTCCVVDFAVPADHKVELKENKKRDKYLDLACELKKLWNMKVIVIPIVIGALGTVTKGLLLGLEKLEIIGQVKTIQTTALLRSARILRRILVIWGDLLTQTEIHQLRMVWKTLKGSK